MGRDNRTIYIGNLPSDVKKWELDDIFYKYGKILDIDIKGFRRHAFMEFDRRQDALEAARGRNGYFLRGRPMNVHITSAPSGPCVSRHTKYRLLIKNLPDTATWQELKSHASMAGKVCYADIYSEETGKAGIVDYLTEEVMQYALAKLQGTEFKNSTSQSNITVAEYDGRYTGQSHSSAQVVAGDKKSMPDVDGDSGPQHSTTGHKRLVPEVDRNLGKQHRCQKAIPGDKTVMPKIEGDLGKQTSGQEAVAGDKRARSDVEDSSSSRSPKRPNKRPRV